MVPPAQTVNPLADPQFADADDFVEHPNPVAPAADPLVHVPEVDAAPIPAADDYAEIAGVAEDGFPDPEPVEPVPDATAVPPVLNTEAVAPARTAHPAATIEARRPPGMALQYRP